MQKLKENNPTANILMNSMRAIGYSFESAIADIVDNSISAHASIIQLNFPIDPSDCYISICDNGSGMTKSELFDAMKYGSQGKELSRQADDLGRFGLGLKSASLSQCRRLTVASKKDDIISAYIWDLDIVAKNQGWFIVECSTKEIAAIKSISFLKNYTSGTVVVWEIFDLIQKSTGNVYSELSKYLDSTSSYLSLIFHRFLNRTGDRKLTLCINNHRLTGLDPFLENHRKTNVRRRIELAILDSAGAEQTVVIQPYILPFQKDLSKADEKLSGGIENYRAKQGFYIYRNERLLIYGTWFNRHRDELTKYARIRVDIPNTLDDIWGIDIKKQDAKIPTLIKSRLTKAVDEAMDLAVKAQRYRGRVERTDINIDFIWDRIKQRGDSFTYQINRESKIFDLIKGRVDDETWNWIDMVLEEVERAVPYQQIYIDKSQNKVVENPQDNREADLIAKLKSLLQLSLATGASDKNAILDILCNSEPFVQHPQLKEKILKDLV